MRRQGQFAKFPLNSHGKYGEYRYTPGSTPYQVSLGEVSSHGGGWWPISFIVWADDRGTSIREILKGICDFYHECRKSYIRARSQRDLERWREQGNDALTARVYGESQLRAFRALEYYAKYGSLEKYKPHKQDKDRLWTLHITEIDLTKPLNIELGDAY